MSSEQIFNDWLNSDFIDPKEKQELLSLSKSEIDTRFNDVPLKFGTSGIRAITGLGTQRLNRFTYRLIGISYARYLRSLHPNPSVLVVHDSRAEGQKWSLEVVAALRHEGINVFLAPGAGYLSTPILSYLIRKRKLHGGISITASHNPRNYNGLKIFNGIGKQLNSEEEREFNGFLLPLKEAINLNFPHADKSEVEVMGASDIDEYAKDLVKSIPEPEYIDRQIPVLFSGFGGTTSELMAKLAHGLGFGMFREIVQRENDLINPEDPSSFRELIEEAEKRGIKYVMCADLDGDRAAMAEKQPDEDWYFFNGNEIGVMLAHFKFKHLPLSNPYIVSTHVTNTLINQLFPHIPIFLSKTGFKNISDIVEREEAKGNRLLIAFEEACGALINPVHREKDSYQQVGYLLKMIGELNSKNKSLRSLLEDLSRTPIGHWRGLTNYYIVGEENLVRFRSQRMVDQLTENAPLKLLGIELENEIIVWRFENQGWIKFRYSGTEPKLKVYYNLFHRDKNELKGWIKEMQRKFSDVLEDRQ